MRSGGIIRAVTNRQKIAQEIEEGAPFLETVVFYIRLLFKSKQTNCDCYERVEESSAFFAASLAKGFRRTELQELTQKFTNPVQREEVHSVNFAEFKHLEKFRV